MSYNPTDANFLTVAQSRTNNGQKDVRILLDITNNIFYSLDDDGNLLPIQSSGGGDLEATLTLGQTSGGLDIILNGNSYLVVDDLGGGMKTSTLGNNIAQYQFSEDGSGNVINQMIVEDVTTLDYSRILIYPNSVSCEKSTADYFRLDDDSIFNVRSISNIQFYRLSGTDLQVLNKVGGELGVFDTTGATPTVLMSVQPRGTITRIKVNVRALKDDNSEGYYAELTGAFRFDSNTGEYVSIGTVSKDEYSDFSTVTSDLVGNGLDVELQVTGEAATKIYWEAEFEYTDN
jgi:hypothetical protein